MLFVQKSPTQTFIDY